MAPKSAKKQEYVHPTASHAQKKYVKTLLHLLDRPELGANHGHSPSLPTRPRRDPFAIEPIFAFYAFLIANLISALFAPIQDCDETFNYWEPTHYLSHGYGLQTWEYSPDYAIRSWLYIAIHAVVGNIRRILPQPTKVPAYLPPYTRILCQLLALSGFAPC